MTSRNKPSPALCPSSGVFADSRTHLFPVRVYYEDTDVGGVVYHTQYLKYAERARSEFFRLACGLDQTDLQKHHGIIIAVRHMDIHFRQPARFEDVLEVRSRLMALRGASFQMEQTILLHRRSGQEALADSIPLVQMTVDLAALNAVGKPTRLPAGLLPVLKTRLV